MSYKNHKDQKLLAEAYKKVIVKENFDLKDPSDVAVGLGLLGGKGLLKLTWWLTKQVFSWATGWTKSNKKIYSGIVERMQTEFGAINYSNLKLKELIKFLIKKNYTTKFVYDLFLILKQTPDITLDNLMAQKGKTNAYKYIVKQIAIELDKRKRLNAEQIKDIKNFLTPPAPTPNDSSYTTGTSTTPSNSQGAGPLPRGPLGF